MALDITGAESILLGVFYMLANMSGVPEVALSPVEAEELTKRINNVQRHYDLKATQKAADWGFLAMTLGGIAIPRAILIASRRRNPAPPAPPPAAPNGVAGPVMTSGGMATRPLGTTEGLVADGPPLPIPPGVPGGDTFH